MPKKRRRKCSGCSTSSCLGCPRRTAGKCVWPGATERPLKLRTCAVNVAITCAGFVLPGTWARTRTCITRLSPGCCFSALCKILTHFVCIFFQNTKNTCIFPPPIFLASSSLNLYFFSNTRHKPASLTHRNLLTVLVVEFKICRWTVTNHVRIDIHTPHNAFDPRTCKTGTRSRRADWKRAAGIPA